MQRARGYREPIERGLAWRFRPSRLAIPAHEREHVALALDEHGWVARQVEPSLFQRVLWVEGKDALGFTLEWIEAVPLRRLLRERGPVGLPALLGVVARLSEATAQLHAQLGSDGASLGLLARCLDPDSTWVTRTGEVRAANPVVVAHLAFAPPDERMVPERVDFLPPEVARGERWETESDVYQIALLALALLLGRSPFSRETPFETLRAAREGELSIDELRELPQAVRTTLMSALDRKPSKRPAGPRELWARLDDVARAAAIAVGTPAELAALIDGLAVEVCGVRAGVPRVP